MATPEKIERQGGDKADRHAQPLQERQVFLKNQDAAACDDKNFQANSGVTCDDCA